ncbi:MAG: hypothetical protein MN733_21025 [Nitrososphaera sp.]|nr:hypothetical protein [Nitrososphaera sp.]
MVNKVIKHHPSLYVNKEDKREWLMENLWAKYITYDKYHGRVPPIPWCELEGKTYEEWVASRREENDAANCKA